MAPYGLFFAINLQNATRCRADHRQEPVESQLRRGLERRLFG